MFQEFQNISILLCYVYSPDTSEINVVFLFSYLQVTEYTPIFYIFNRLIYWETFCSKKKKKNLLRNVINLCLRFLRATCVPFSFFITIVLHHASFLSLLLYVSFSKLIQSFKPSSLRRIIVRLFLYFFLLIILKSKLKLHLIHIYVWSRVVAYTLLVCFIKY